MRFNTEAEIDAFMARFEAGTIPKGEWMHRAHLAAAGAYVWRAPNEALTLMRFGILNLNRCHGTKNSASSGYHETLTVFWIEIVRGFCENRKASDRLAVINEMLALLSAALFREYYGFDVTKSHIARGRWVQPDLKKL
jgi:hypothetical protein